MSKSLGFRAKSISTSISGIILLAVSSCSAFGSLNQNPSSSINISPQSTQLSLSDEEIDLPSSLRFERIEASDDLSSNAIRQIYQDRTGYLWIGTQDGLNKYDGYSFQIFRNDPDSPNSLRDNFIETIYEDRSGVIWVGTQSGWLEKYDPATNSFSHYQLGSRIISIYEDNYGKLWIGTFKPGLLVFDQASETTELIIAGEHFSSIIEDSAGNLWATSPVEGLFLVDPLIREPEIISTNYPITQMISGDKDQIWMATNGGGVSLLDPATRVIKYFQGQSEDQTRDIDWISSIQRDKWGRIWFGSWNNGLFYFDPEIGISRNFQNDPLDHNSLSNNNIVSILVDFSGVLWTGNEFGGLNKALLNTFDFGYNHHRESDKNSLAEGIVTSFAEDREGKLWIGTLGGLSSWDRENDIWENYIEIDEEEIQVRSLYIDQVDRLWVGTEEGLFRYDRESDKLIPYDSLIVMWMTEDLQGNFWMSTKEGLFKYDPESGEKTLVNKGISWKIMVFEDLDGNVWVGSSGDGLDVLNSSSGVWQHFENNSSEPNSLSGNFVETIHQDREGRIWIGTNSGLNLYDSESETFINYYVPDGLPHDYVVGILEGLEGELWLSTLGGLSRFDPDTVTFENYYSSDGLQDNNFWRNSYLMNDSGEMLFGGINGFNIFHPGQVKKNPYLPPIIITSISLYNQPRYSNIQNGDRIELNYQENFISLDFAALDFSNPMNNQFAYQLEGLDDQWVEIGNRNHVDYPDLDPGRYTFRVIGSNNDGVWNTTGAWVDIVISPPFWMTWWFRSVMMAFLLFTIYVVYRLRIRQLSAHNLELENEVKERTEELRLEIDQRAEAEIALINSEKEKAVLDERNRLARELHDAVTQSLFSASLLAEAIPTALHEDPEEAKRLLGDLRGLNKGALAEMRTLLLELRPGVLGEVSIADLLHQLSEAAGAREDIVFHLEIEELPKLPLNVHIAFYRIAQESLNNIIKHAQPDTVWIDVKSKSRFDSPLEGVELTIRDNGLGFDPDDVSPGSMGLGIMAERAKDIGGDFSISSQVGEGTRVQLTWVGEDREGILDD